MTAPINLDENIPIVNFSLVQGVTTSIQADLTAVPAVDISTWPFEVNFYTGIHEAKTVIITKAGGGISVDAGAMTLIATFSSTSIAGIIPGPYPCDVRYTDGAGAIRQLIKGVVTLKQV